MYRSMKQFSAVAFVAMALSSFANAQATRTWVSGVGDDANPCSRTAPCKTFAGAISKTAAGGEIDALDPAGFGGVTITKSILIDGGGSLASVLVGGTNGITVAAGAADVVILRNLSFEGVGTGLNAINFISGLSLVVEHCSIFKFTQNGINVSLAANGNLSVQDVSITGGADGVKIAGTATSVTASLNRVSIKGATNGVHGLYGLTNVTNSVITANTGVGVLSEGTGIVSLTNSLLVGNQVAVQADTGSTVRLSNNDVYDNQTGFACGGGTLASAANNRKAGNVGGSVSVCSPTVSITLQ